MPGLTLREFECTLCRQPFTLLAADLILPAPEICDECLGVVWDLDDSALERHVAACLAADAPQPGDDPPSPAAEPFPVTLVLQHIEWHRQQGERAEDLIQRRERERGPYG